MFSTACFLSHSVGENPADMSFTLNLGLHRHWDGREANWRRPGWNTTASFCSRVWWGRLFFRSQWWVAQSCWTPFLVDDMHCNVHSWKYTAVSCTKTEERAQREEEKKHTLTWVCFVINVTFSTYQTLTVHVSSSPKNSKRRVFLQDAISEETIHLVPFEILFVCVF